MDLIILSKLVPAFYGKFEVQKGENWMNLL